MAINDPRDIPGLLVWYSAQAETSYADGAVMTGWTDLSGNGNHATIRTNATPLWFATGGANNGPRIAGFADNSGPGGTGDGGGFMLPASVTTGLSAAYAAISVRPEATGYGPWNFGADAQTSHFPHGNGNIYDEFGTTARKTVGAGLTMNVWHRYAVRSKAGAWTAWLDGAQKFTTATNTVGWVTGQAPSLGDSGSGLSPLYASLGLFLLYNREPTTAEQADLDAWIAANPSGGVATGATAAFMSATLAGAAGVTASLGLHPAKLKATLAPSAAMTASARRTVAMTATVAGDGNLAATLSILGRVDLAASMSATATLAADLLPFHVTNTSTRYANLGGYNYHGESEVDYEPPVAPNPARVRPTPIQRVHQSLPVPTLVDGRPV